MKLTPAHGLSSLFALLSPHVGWGISPSGWGEIVFWTVELEEK